MITQTSQTFPNKYCLGWVPRIYERMRPTYTRDPISHTVSKFELGSSRKIIRSATQYTNLGGLNYEGRRFNRQKGVVEYHDLSSAFHPRPNSDFRSLMTSIPAAFRIRSNPITQYADDAVAHHELPFRYPDFTDYYCTVQSTTPSQTKLTTVFIHKIIDTNHIKCHMLC